MNAEIKSLVNRIETVHNGEPWFGRPVFALLDDIDPASAYHCPGGVPHSAAELLYHMITWAEFTLKRIEEDPEYDPALMEELDWRPLNPKVHTWKKGLAAYKSVLKKIITRLAKKEDAFLDEKVNFRKYNFRFLVNGMIEHTIYHSGQIAFLAKMNP